MKKLIFSTFLNLPTVVFVIIVLLSDSASGSAFHPRNHTNWPKYTESICGISSTNRIVGGENASLGEHPWIAQIGFANVGYKIYFCGAGLISKRYALTAAHCTANIKQLWHQLVVKLGELNLETDPDCENGVCADKIIEIKVEMVIQHKGYNAGKTNDIALLKLDTPVTFSKWVKPICLPFHKLSLVDKYVDMIGFGYTNSTTEASPTVLQKISLKVSPNKIFKTRSLRISDSQFIVATMKKDSCKGDSGGPVLITDQTPNGPRLFQCGIVSFGPKKCGSGTPGVYTKVDRYMNWILNNLNE